MNHNQQGMKRNTIIHLILSLELRLLFMYEIFLIKKFICILSRQDINAL